MGLSFFKHPCLYTIIQPRGDVGGTEDFVADERISKIAIGSSLRNIAFRM